MTDAGVRDAGLPVPGAPDVVTRSITAKALWEDRRSVIGWSVSVAAVGAMYGAFWPTMDTPEMKQAISSYPEELLQALDYTDLTTAAGYVGSTVYGLLGPALVAVYAIATGSRTIAGEEDDGILEVLLTHPVSRLRVALERFAAMLVTLLLMAFALWLAMVLISRPAHLDGISPGDLAAAGLQLALFGAAIGSVAFGIGAATGRRAVALAGASAVTVIGYLAMGVFPQFGPLEWTRDISVWEWFVGGKPLADGVQWLDCGLLLALTAVCAGAGTWIFTRRDITV